MAAKTKKPKLQDSSNLDVSIGDDPIGETLQEPKPKKEKRSLFSKKEKAWKRERKGGGRVLPILLGLFIIAGLTALLFFNVFGVRSRYVTPLLQKVPIVKNLVGTEEPDTGDPYATSTKEELAAQINDLKRLLEQQSAAHEELEAANRIHLERIANLEEIEAQQLQFKADKEAFDRMIAEHDPAAYAQFYESVSPENAGTLYQEAVVKVQQTKEFKKYINTVQSVDEAEAAKILEELVKTDMNLVVLILNNISSDQSGAIISNMDPTVAASVIKQMSPPQP